MIWDILEKKIVDANLAIAGKTFFRDSMPGGTKIGIMTKAPLNGISVDPYMPGWYRPNLQIIVRHTDPVLGEALANAVSDVLTVEGPEDHPATLERKAAKISLFYPRELPIAFPRLDGNAREWSLNFRTAFTFLR